MTTGRINQVAFLLDIAAGKNTSALLPGIVSAARVVFLFITGLHNMRSRGNAPNAESFPNPNTEHKHYAHSPQQPNGRLVARNKRKLHDAPTDTTMSARSARDFPTFVNSNHGIEHKNTTARETHSTLPLHNETHARRPVRCTSTEPDKRSTQNTTHVLPLSLTPTSPTP